MSTGRLFRNCDTSIDSSRILTEFCVAKDDTSPRIPQFTFHLSPTFPYISEQFNPAQKRHQKKHSFLPKGQKQESIDPLLSSSYPIPHPRFPKGIQYPRGELPRNNDTLLTSLRLPRNPRCINKTAGKRLARKNGRVNVGYNTHNVAWYGNYPFPPLLATRFTSIPLLVSRMGREVGHTPCEKMPAATDLKIVR